MSRVLVVTYSHTGTSRRLAALLCGQQGWPMAEIFDARPRGNGPLAAWRCLLDSWLRREPAIRCVGPSPEGFDLVVLIAPIWANQLAGPMRSFVASRRASLPDVAVAPVMAGRGAPNAIAEVGRLIGRAPIVSAAFTSREVDDGSCAARLQAFGDSVRAAKHADTGARSPTLSSQAA